MANNYQKEQAQEIKATRQEMDAWEALRREPGLMGRLARRGKNMKRSYVGGRRSFDKEVAKKSKSESKAAASSAATHAKVARMGTRAGLQDTQKAAAAESGGGGQTSAQKAAAAKAAAAAAAVKAEKAAAAKAKKEKEEKVGKERSTRRKGLVEGVMKDAEGRVEGDKGVMTDAAGKVEGDEGYDKETAELKGGYDESTGKLDTEGSLEGIRQDYKGLREDADYSETREDLEGYQSEADKLKGEAAGKYAGYESDIAGQPDYASKVAEMAAAQATTGTKAQTDLAALAEGIDTSTTAGKKALKDAAAAQGIAASDIKAYESKVGEFAQAGQTAATEAATGIKAAAGRGETAAQTGAAGIQAAAGRGEAAAGRGEAAAGQGQANLAAATAAQQQAAQAAAAGVTGAAGAGQAGITAAGGQGMTQAQQAQQAMGAASSKLGGMADTAMDTGALMKDRGLFAGQIEAKSKAAQQGKLGNLRRSMAASGASPAEIARAEAEASGGAQSGREDALAASMAAMQSGQGQLGQAAGLTGQQAQIAAQGGQLGLSGAGQGLQAAQAAGQMGMQGAQSAGQFGMAGGAAGMQGALQGAQLGMSGAQMGMQGAQMGMQGAQQAGQMGMAGAGMGMQGAQSAGQMGMAGNQMGMAGAGQQAGMAGQRAGIAGQQGAMGLQGAQLGLAGSGQKAQNIQAGAGQAMQGQQGAMQGYGAAQGLGIGKTQAAAGMYGQGLGAQQGLMNMGASLSKDQQTSQMNEITQQQGLTAGMAGMTEAQLQDVVAKQNAAQQKDLAERGLLMQSQANAASRPQGPTQQQQFMDFAKTAVMAKAMFACIPKGITIDMASGDKTPVEDISVGDFVMGLNGKSDEVLQVHQYKQDPEPDRFVTVTFDDGSKVNCSDKHRISNKRAEDYKLQDKVGNREVTSIDRYNGVSRSFDLLTATGGYRINGVPVNTMIPEMAEVITEFNKTIKLAA